MKNALWFVAAMLMVAGSARADQVTMTETVSAELAECFANCESTVTTIAPAPAPTKVSTKRTARKSSNRSSSSARASAMVTVDLGPLTRRVEELEKWRSEHADQVSSEVAIAIATLRQELTTVNETADEDGVSTEDYRELAELVASMNKRLTQLERMLRAEPFANSLGITFGALLLTSGHDFEVSAMSLGGRLSLGISRDVYLYVDPSLLFAPGADHGFGAMIGGGVGYALFESGNYAGALEVGLDHAAIALHNNLKSEAVTDMAVLGLNFRLPEGFRAYGAALIGVKFDPFHDPDLGLGGKVGLGVDF